MREIIEAYFPDFKRVGREYHGPCFRCGGEDRFVVWPEQGNQGLFRVWCRQCNYTEDALGFVMASEGLDWAGAHRRLGIPLPDGELTAEDIARRALAHQIALRESRAPEEITEASRFAELRDLFADATTNDLIGYIVSAFDGRDRAQMRAALDHMGGRLVFLLAFLGEQRSRRPVATDTFIQSISGLSSAREVYDSLGIDHRTLDQIDRIGFFTLNDERSLTPG